jgi:branched-chain amino acid transport system permease protein
MFSALAASWDLVAGYTGIYTFCHPAFMSIGAYTAALLSIHFGLSPWLGLLAGGCAAALSCFPIGFPVLKLRGLAAIGLVTLAFTEIVRIIFSNLVDLTRGELGLWEIPPFPPIHIPYVGTVVFGTGDRIGEYYVILLLSLSIIFTIRRVVKSDLGLRFRAIRDDQDAAESMGINSTKYKLLSFVLSGFFAGVIGSSYAYYYRILVPSIFIVSQMIIIMTIVIVGGRGTLIGPVVTAFLLIPLEEILRPIGEVRLVVYGAFLIIVLIFSPDGITKKALDRLSSV